jgi:voltage-gated potassium channel
VNRGKKKRKDHRADTMADATVFCPSRGRVAMIELFITTLRFARALLSAWRRDPQFRSLMLLVVVTLVGGTILYSTVEGWSAVDALYFSVTTLTTVGFGDLTPTTALGKLFTVIYIFAGLGLVVGFVNVVAKETLEGRTRRGSSEDVEGRTGS